ncbi:MAG TPA: hypothetical protein VMW58_01585 [Anaerolineae bacterium]|nr:hypothetical protein [Anaerolineae bacterium]
MKGRLIARLGALKKSLRTLKKNVTALPGDRVSRKAPRDLAASIADTWVEDLRSPLEHKFLLPERVIRETSDQMKRLHVLSRPNNLKKSYIETIDAILADFDDKFILPIQQTSLRVEAVLDLRKLIPGLSDPDESDYLVEAIECATFGHRRASVVMGWCAAIDRIQRKLLNIGLPKFNQASTALKNQTSGKFKKWNKEFAVSTLSELQAVFDSDIIMVLEGMQLIDGNQADRLRVAFQYRNQSAHPGSAPIEDAHLVAFFTDISAIVLRNPAFRL